MIAGIIRWSARNGFLVLLATAFIVFAGIYAVRHTALDAIPDLSDTQVIVYTEYPGQAPQVIEDQVTYPLTTALLAVPRSKVVRGFSFFGVSFVYVVFEVGTDLYWARSRVLEYLNFAAKRFPEGVTPSLGPDATGVGWVYQYVVLGAERTLAELRTIQDWYLRYQLTKAEGVAEVASVGGFVQQYQVVVDPQKLQAYGLTLPQIAAAIRASNRDVGGRVVEMSETEYVVRGRGYLRNSKDLEEIALKMHGGTPVLLRDVARVELGPEERRGIAELNGQGEVVSGIALQRDGQNALHVIDSVKQKLAEIAPSLPKGVHVEAVHDRSDLIHRAIETLKHTLTEESIIVALVGIVFLLHVRSALVAILMLPVGVLIATGLLHALGLSSNIMSLGGIAIALGAMVDAAIVMIENAHKHLERAAPGASRAKILTDAAIEVGPALFFPRRHHRVFPAGVHARRSGRPSLQTACADQDLRHGRGGVAVDHSCAGADAAVRARPHPARGAQPPEPGADLALSADHCRRPAPAHGDDPDCPIGVCCHRHPPQADWLGIYADAQ
jgi:Cu(I)/Ag(I) efflux system membrane protein CusA/SilA